MKTLLELRRRAREAQAGAALPAGTKTKGLLVLFTGDGKGKTTAALGMARRALHAGKKVGIVQFLGGSSASAEYAAVGQHALCTFKIFGDDFDGAGASRHADIAISTAAWREASVMLANPSFDMVILDDINPLIQFAYLNIDVIARNLSNRAPHMHVVLTGCRAPYELIDMADLVTEMRKMKHPYPGMNLAPQAGIEF